MSSAPAEPEGVPCSVSPAARHALPNGVATAGGPPVGPGVSVDSCRPVAGDIVRVRAGVPAGDGAALLGRRRHLVGSRLGRLLVPGGAGHPGPPLRGPGSVPQEVTGLLPCSTLPEKAHRAWIVATAGRVASIAGAAPCRGMGLSRPGEPAKVRDLGQSVPVGGGTLVEMVLNRCAVPVGTPSELVVLGGPKAIVVDWGDGTPSASFPSASVRPVVHTYGVTGVRAMRLVGPRGWPTPRSCHRHRGGILRPAPGRAGRTLPDPGQRRSKRGWWRACFGGSAVRVRPAALA